VDQARNNGDTPLFVAASRGGIVPRGKTNAFRLLILRLLIHDGKANVDQADNEGVTPLIEAARNGDADVVRVLLEEGKADPNVKCGGMTAYDVAKAERRRDVLSVLTSK